MQSSESQRDVLRTSGSIASVRRAHLSESKSFGNDGGIQDGICSPVKSPQRRRPGHPHSTRVSPSRLSSSAPLSKVGRASENHDHSIRTLRRKTTRRILQPSSSTTSIPGAITLEHSERAYSSVMSLSRLPEGNTSSPSHGQGRGMISSGSLVSLLSPPPKRAHSRRKPAESINTLEVRRSYTVFQRKFFRLKRQERTLLLDNQWVHVLPSSTKTLNVVFDTRISVSYHVRLLTAAKVKSGAKSSIVTICFKKGSKGRFKTYNLKAANRSIAVEIVQMLWQLRAQFADKRAQSQVLTPA